MTSPPIPPPTIATCNATPPRAHYRQGRARIAANAACHFANQIGMPLGVVLRLLRAAVRQKAGRIIIAGMTKEVAFAPVDGLINNRIDDAYRVTYVSSPELRPMIGARARSATVRITLRKT